MKAVILCAMLLAMPAPAAKVTPVQKVIQLMTGMVEKGKKEKQDEAVQFASYKTFCDNTVSQKQAAIAKANEMMEVLSADIEKYGSEAERLSGEIAAHDADISTWEGDSKAATRVREIENTDYVATHKDYSESIMALEGAIATLKAQDKDVKQAAAAFTQLKVNLKDTFSKLFPPEATRVINAFLARDKEDENLAIAAPEANAYEFQASGIVDMLSKLLGKFSDERDALEKKEDDAVHSFEVLAADLRNQLDTANTARTQKSEAKAKALQAGADAKGALGDTTGTMEADSKYAADLTATCEQKSTDFANPQILRAEEIEAVEKAIELMSSGAVTGNADKHLPALAQIKKTSFAQLRADAQNPNQVRVAAYLKRQATTINSRVLSVLATRVAADPFKKVKKMIKDLIVKLMEEAQAETEQKGWCDTEMSTNKHTREEKTEAVELLTAEIDELTASIAKLTEDLTELTTAVSELDAAVAEATEQRTAEKEKNTVTISDSQA